MPVSQSVANFIRAVFRRETRQSEVEPDQQNLITGDHSLYSTMGLNSIDQFLKLEQTLLGRFADYEDMDDYPDLSCLGGDTLIVTIHGPMAIRELAELGADKFHVLSFDKQCGRAVIAEAKNARCTGKMAETVEIRLSNERVTYCTLEHLWMMRSGEYVEAQNLKVGSLLMPYLVSPSSHPEDGFFVKEISSGPKMDVYDIEVPEFHNFAIGSGVFVHNSALDIYSDDSTQVDGEKNKTVWVESPDENVQADLEDVFYNRIRVEEEGWEITRSTGKYGNDYEEILVNDNGVQGLSFLPAPTIRRFEGENNNVVGFAQSFKNRFNVEATSFKKEMEGGISRFGSDDLTLFEPWKIVHFRLRSKNRRSPYGYSLFEPARWIYKRLLLLEDSALIYRLTRAPARFAFYIDVGDLPAKEALSYVEKIKNKYKKQKFVNEQGKLDMRYNPLCLAGDTKISLLDGRSPTVKELAEEFEAGKENWVYSVDRKNNNKVVPGKIIWAGGTRKNAELLEVELDNGKVVRATPDHKFILRTGEYREAKDLTPGDSLMPLIFKKSMNKDVVYDPKCELFFELDDLRQFKTNELNAHIVEHSCNHKVKAVRKLEQREDAYTLTIDKWHNFGLEAGIYIKNSKDEDFFVPTRKGQESTRIDMMSGNEYQCLTGDTKIPLLDGTVPTIKELTERDDSFWVYSIDCDGKIVPGKGYSARKTKLDYVWEIDIDGKVVRCSDNHPFLLRDGSWKRADQLVPGDRLMPLYRQLSSKKKGNRLDGYEQVYSPYDKRYLYTHQLVHRYKTGKLDVDRGYVTHHNTFNKLDNRPESLSEITKAEHSRIHLEHHDYLHTEEVRHKIRLSKSNPDTQRKVAESFTPERRAEISSRMVERMKDPAERQRAREQMCYYNKSFEHKSAISGELNCNWRNVGLKDLIGVVQQNNVKRIKDLYPLGYSQKLIQRILKNEQLTWGDFASQYIGGWVPQGRGKCEKKPLYLNHVVSAVRRTEQKEWLYDLTVEKHHNFAIEQGVIVHNSMDDVDYFRMKLYAAMKVPRAYLGYEDTISRATLCLAGDTVIPLLNGAKKTIKELSEEFEQGNQESSLVYSCHSDGTAVKGVLEGAKLTRPKAETVQIVLDNGKEVICTPDHPFMLTNGTYRNAEKLTTSDELMTFRASQVVVEIAASGKYAPCKMVERNQGPVVDTYDLTVRGYHNFAIGAGIFVHNSQEDVRFARSVLRVQREIRNGFHKIGRVHLAAVGLDPAATEFEIYMTVPSAVFELAQMEVRNARVALANEMRDWASERWIYENVFGFTDTEIERIMKERLDDAVRSASIEGRQEKLRMGQIPPELRGFAGEMAGGEVDTGAGAGAGEQEAKLVKTFRGQTFAERRFWDQLEQQVMRGNKQFEKSISRDQVAEILRGNKKMDKRFMEIRLFLNDLRDAMKYRKAA